MHHSALPANSSTRYGVRQPIWLTLIVCSLAAYTLISCKTQSEAKAQDFNWLVGEGAAYHTPDQITYVYRYFDLDDYSPEKAAQLLTTTIAHSVANAAPRSASADARDGVAGFGAYASADPFATALYGKYMAKVAIKANSALALLQNADDAFSILLGDPKKVIAGDASALLYRFDYAGKNISEKKFQISPYAVVLRKDDIVDYEKTTFYSPPSRDASYDPRSDVPPVASADSLDAALNNAFQSDARAYSYIGGLSYVNGDVKPIGTSLRERLAVLARAYPKALYEISGQPLAEIARPYDTETKMAYDPTFPQLRDLHAYLSYLGSYSNIQNMYPNADATAKAAAAYTVPQPIVDQAKAQGLVADGLSGVSHADFLAAIAATINAKKPDLLDHVAGHIDNFRLIMEQTKLTNLSTWSKGAPAAQQRISPAKDRAPKDDPNAKRSGDQGSGQQGDQGRGDPADRSGKR